MSKLVTGIGGIFFRSKDNKALAKWYQEHFGIEAGGDQVWNQEAGMTVFAPFKHDTDYFGSQQQFMINFRVSDLSKLLEELRSKGVKTEPGMQEESYGKFAWVYDPEGNKIELWEPSA
jgi:glyoxylase I family protein